LLDQESLSEQIKMLSVFNYHPEHLLIGK
jgi:hypothetical protein